MSVVCVPDGNTYCIVSLLRSLSLWALRHFLLFGFLYVCACLRSITRSVSSSCNTLIKPQLFRSFVAASSSLSNPHAHIHREKLPLSLCCHTYAFTYNVLYHIDKTFYWISEPIRSTHLSTHFECLSFEFCKGNRNSVGSNCEFRDYLLLRHRKIQTANYSEIWTNEQCDFTKIFGMGLYWPSSPIKLMRRFDKTSKCFFVKRTNSNGTLFSYIFLSFTLMTFKKLQWK